MAKAYSTHDLGLQRTYNLHRSSLRTVDAPKAHTQLIAGFKRCSPIPFPMRGLQAVQRRFEPLSLIKERDIKALDGVPRNGLLIELEAGGRRKLRGSGNHPELNGSFSNAQVVDAKTESAKQPA